MIDSLSPAQLTRLAHLLDSPTGGELRRDLREARLPLGVERTKWRMLRESFELAQRQSGSANPVLRFVKLALDPARELEAADLTETRVGVNEVLLLSGLKVSNDGSLVVVKASRTAADARTRADRLRERLRERGVHPDVMRFCKPELVQRNYFHAVFEAGKCVSAKIRERTGIDADGAELADQAFTLKSGMPPLAFNSLQSKSDRSAHRGYEHFVRGVVAAFRNPPAHEPKIEYAITEEDALDMLATISMIHRRLDQASVTPAAPIYSAMHAHA